MSTNPRSKLHSDGSDFTREIHHDTYEYIQPAQFDLKGRAVLITGASKGVGRATAISYAKAGASQIAVAARSDLQDLEAEMGLAANDNGKTPPQVLRLKLDVVDEQSVADAAQTVETVFGRLDILVNNAGYLENFVPITESKVDDWWKTWEVNIKGIYLTTRALLPLMLATKDGLLTVLNVSSIGAHNQMPGASGYQCGKLAVLRFSEFLNLDYAEHDLLSFSIHPGGVPTELALQMPEKVHGVLIDTPQLAGDSVVWLTAQRRAWLKGRYVSCTWDMEELVEKRPKIERDDLLKVRMDVGLE